MQANIGLKRTNPGAWIAGFLKRWFINNVIGG
jgi:hypothetical protein